MMKKTLLLFAMLLSVIVASAKDVKTIVFTTNPIMHCESCENKIKGNLRFEKGVKEIETNVEKQRVTVKYDASKTNVEKLQKAFSKFGYEATVVTEGDCEQKPCCGKKKEEAAEGQMSCCGKKKENCGEKKPACHEQQKECKEQKAECGEQKSCCGMK